MELPAFSPGHTRALPWTHKGPSQPEPGNFESGKCGKGKGKNYKNLNILRMKRAFSMK